MSPKTTPRAATASAFWCRRPRGRACSTNPLYRTGRPGVSGVGMLRLPGPRSAGRLNLRRLEPAHSSKEALEDDMKDRGDAREARGAGVKPHASGQRPSQPAAPATHGKTIRWARLYDLGTTWLSFGRLSALHRTVVALAGIERGARVLDVGCGP